MQNRMSRITTEKRRNFNCGEGIVKSGSPVHTSCSKIYMYGWTSSVLEGPPYCHWAMMFDNSKGNHGFTHWCSSLLLHREHVAGSHLPSEAYDSPICIYCPQVHVTLIWGRVRCNRRVAARYSAHAYIEQIEINKVTQETNMEILIPWSEPKFKQTRQCCPLQATRKNRDQMDGGAELSELQD